MQIHVDEAQLDPLLAHALEGEAARQVRGVSPGIVGTLDGPVLLLQAVDDLTAPHGCNKQNAQREITETAESRRTFNPELVKLKRQIQ